MCVALVLVLTLSVVSGPLPLTLKHGPQINNKPKTQVSRGGMGASGHLDADTINLEEPIKL